jgi:gliding motility-associated transport system permease protein
MFIPIYKRELKAYFQSPVLYVILGIFTFLMAYFILSMIIEFSDMYTDQKARQSFLMESMNVTEWIIGGFFGLVNFMMLIIIPLITMRLIAEEKKNRTFEVLMASPVSDEGIIAAKYLAALTIILIMLGSCFVYPLIIEKFSEPEWPVIFTGYLGLILTSMAFLAFGLFASSITENQIIASFLSFSGLLFFYLVGDVTSSREGLIGEISMALSIRRHGMSFSKGILDTTDIFYLVAFTVFFLFLSLEALKIRRWRS